MNRAGIMPSHLALRRDGLRGGRPLVALPAFPVDRAINECTLSKYIRRSVTRVLSANFGKFSFSRRPMTSRFIFSTYRCTFSMKKYTGACRKSSPLSSGYVAPCP
jgi:hypothetical protein